jgi:glucokinase
MAEASRTFVGIEIGGTKLQVVAGDGAGHILRRWRATVDPAMGSDGIRPQLLNGLEEIRAAHPPLAIGVGFGGPVDRTTGRIARSHQVGGWEGFALREWLAELSKLPVVVENDSNTAALAEATCGAGRGQNPVFYFNLGSGVGGGLVIDGTIYHGIPPGEMEFGHVKLDRSGATVESRCSGWAVDRRIAAHCKMEPGGTLGQLVGNARGGEASHLPAALAQRDPTAERIIAEIADDLGFALSHVVHLVHPGVVVLGGGLSLIGEPLRGAVADALRKYVMEAFAPGPPLRLAALGEDAVPVGALLLAAAAS